jgi:hypothetical protein
MGVHPVPNDKSVEAVAAWEKITDRNCYYQKRAGELQREISQELAARHLLREVRSNAAPANTAKPVALRIAFALIAFLTLLLLHFLG